MDRIVWVDYMKGIAMFLVVLSHSEGVPTLVEYFFRPFFLTSFFFASGYLFHNPSKPFNIRKKLVRLTESILIPYLLYWIISFVVDKSIDGYSIGMVLRGLAESILSGQKLWFISCLLCAEIIMCVNLYISRSPLYILSSGIASFFLWYFTGMSKPGAWVWCVNMAFLAYLYLSLGYCFKAYERHLSEYLTNGKAGLSISLVYCILIYLDYQYFNYGYSFALNWFTDIWYYILSSLAGLAMLYYLYNKLKANAIVTFLGLNSMLVYFFHNQMLNILKHISNTSLLQCIPDWGICLFQSVGTMILVYVPILITNKYLPAMSGKSKWLTNILYKHEK